MEPIFRTTVPAYRLGELLLRISELRLSGRLELTTDLGDRTIHVHSGYPVFAHSSQFAERLGAIGVRYSMLRREDVADALALAREKQCELGRALLELELLDGCQLFRLLSAQLVEQLAATCMGGVARARFHADPVDLSKVAILRVHPLTAVLAAVRHLASAEQTRLLTVLASARVNAVAPSEPVRSWLSDIGYLGDAATLVTEGTTVSSLRGRLVARLRASTQQDFDPTASPTKLEARKEDSVRPPARSVADYLTLALLFSGAVTLAADDAATLVDRSDALIAGLYTPLPPLSFESVVPPPLASSVDKSIVEYLDTPREARLAARMAIWGAGAEIADDEALKPLLTLYLTLKPEKNDAAVLDVKANADAATVAAAHTKYHAFIDMLGGQLGTPLARARTAELHKRIDDARLALRPSYIPSEAPAAEAPDVAADVEPSHRDSTALVEATNAAVIARASLPPESETDVLLRNVDARVREGNWQKVIDLIEPQLGRGRALPPTLALAQTLAQRELSAVQKAPRSRRFIVLALVLGIAAGFALRHYGGLDTSFLPRIPRTSTGSKPAR